MQLPVLALMAAALSSPLSAQLRAAAPVPIDVSGPQFVALSVSDLPASTRWYQELFGLGVLFEAASPDSTTRVILLGNARMRVELVYHRDARSLAQLTGRPLAPDMVYGAPKIGFYVRDLDEALATLRARGVTFEGTWMTRPANIAPTDTVWARNLMVRDNSGTLVQFMELPGQHR